VILSGPFLTEAELAQAIASLEARAELAERNGLSRTARSWRDAIKNLAAAEEMRAAIKAATPPPGVENSRRALRRSAPLPLVASADETAGFSGNVSENPLNRPLNSH
jgi:hypothetical protein